jgi:hypothetical protein
MSVLNGSHRARGAEYRHGDRKGCLKGTRESVLNEIERWTQDFDESPVFWLNGLAGTGKSAIAQTVAERAFADGRLGASFFCSRGAEDRSDLRLIFPTLAFQLAQQYPEFRPSLISLLLSNPNIVHESLHDQMQQFLVEPLLSAKVSTVVVIDALDECRDEDSESSILPVLGHLIPKIPMVKFFITSRLEPHIMAGFRHSLLAKSTHVFILHNVEPDAIDNDIRHFFKHELSELARKRRSRDDWLTDEHLDFLCRRAAGFFIYAVATLSFLKHKVKHPRDRLDIIMRSPENTAYEGRAELKMYIRLDSLYTSIFQAAFPENDDGDATVRSTLSAVVLATTPLSQPAIATLMDFSRHKVQRLLELIQSILVLPENPNHPVQLFHKSFPDFITDPTRCTDKRFYISPDYHTKLALCCLKLIAKSMENVDSAPDYVWREEPGVREAVEYARMSWDKHLLVTKDRAVEVVNVLRSFLESVTAQPDGLRSEVDGCGAPRESTQRPDLLTSVISVPPCLIVY